MGRIHSFVRFINQLVKTNRLGAEVITHFGYAAKQEPRGMSPGKEKMHRLFLGVANK